MNPTLLLDKLKESSSFKEWSNNHLDSFPSHFFCQIDSTLKEKGDWEIGFYNKENDKISTFIVNETFSLKPEDNVFKKPGDLVEKINLDDVKLDIEKAKEIFNQKHPELFPNEQLGDGFVVLQTLKEKTQWNFSLITKSLKFLNIKINASSGEVDSHQVVELVQK